jgi:hypothetical protein
MNSRISGDCDRPLNRQNEQFALEGVELSVSTMADHVGACTAMLLALAELIKAHVFAPERIHGDDTTVPVLAKVKTKTGRLWTYVRDDRPFGGPIRPPRRTSTRPIAAARIRSSIWPATPGYFKPTLGDPIVFALRDRNSSVCAVFMIAVVLIAS